VKQTEYQWLHVWAAIEPATGESWTMLTPDMNTAQMNTLLAGIAGTLRADDLAVLVLDNAGWHRAKALAVPANIVLLFLPPYSPELQPVERLWAWMRSHHLSNRVYADYGDMLHAADKAIQALDQSRLKTLCACSWMTPRN
jgi:DDE superfamily endonuclease